MPPAQIDTDVAGTVDMSNLVPCTDADGPTCGCLDPQEAKQVERHDGEHIDLRYYEAMKSAGGIPSGDAFNDHYFLTDASKQVAQAILCCTGAMIEDLGICF